MLPAVRLTSDNGAAKATGLGFVLGILLLTACAVPAQVDGPAPPVGGDAPIQSIVSAVLADAMERTGLDLEALELLSTEAVMWPDGSLGCPRPGVEHTQAPVPGYRIRIRAGEQTLGYHASRKGYWVLCPSGSSQDPLPGAVDR